MAKKAEAVATEERVLTPVQQKFETARREINLALIEREGEVDMVMTALLGGYHPLMVGPPGVAKSLLSDAICRFINGRTFDTLLGKYSVPEELFGPYSLIALQADRFERVTDFTFLDCDIAFLDEIFKASPAILNTLLKALNERTYRNGKTVMRLPLQMAIAASNEWPNDQDGGKELGALFDRFLLRKLVKPVATAAGRTRLLWDRDHTPKLTVSLTPVELQQARTEALALKWTADAKEAYMKILKTLNADGILVGDRRQYQSVNVAQAYAYLCGDTTVQSEHLEILQYTMWTDPGEQPEKAAKIVVQIANPMGAQISQWLGEAQQIIEQADVSDLASLVAQDKKLQEIERRLKGLKESDKQRAALTYLKRNRDEMRIKGLQRTGFGDE